MLLSGSGVFDGSEIHKAVPTIALSKRGATVQIIAPNKQHHVINHLTGEEMNETRLFLWKRQGYRNSHCKG